MRTDMSDMRYYLLSFDIGYLYADKIKDFLQECHFNGMDIEWMCTTENFKTTFKVKSTSEITLYNIQYSISEWSDKVEKLYRWF
jgi:hypothetical protein